MSTNNHRLTIEPCNHSSSVRIFICNSIYSIIIVLIAAIGLLHDVALVKSVPIAFNRSSTKSREPISLEEAFLGELRPKDFEFDWIAAKGAFDNELHDQLIYEESKNILLVDLPSIERRNGTSGTLLPSPRYQPQILNNFKPNITVLVSNSSVLASIDFQGHKLSPSKRYLLLFNSRRKQFRHSFTAKYFLYDIKLDLVSLLSTKQSHGQITASGGLPSFEEDNEYMRFQNVEWYSSETSDGFVDSLIMIQNNDIYKLYDVSRLSDGPSSLAASPGTKTLNPQTDNYALPVRLTYNGREGVIFNGVPDWLYEEEILSGTPALQISPLSSHLAYMTFDDSNVNIMPYTIYGDSIIPRIQLIRYPKAGQPNPRVTVSIVENFSRVSGEASNVGSPVILPADLQQEQHYINRIQWLTDERLALIWSSRNQSTTYVVICSAPSATASGVRGSPATGWKCEKNLHMKVDNGWLDIGDDLLPLNGDHYLALIPKFENSKDGFFKHIAKVSIREPNKFVFLTSGAKEVISFNGIDYKRSLVYYMSTVPGHPGQRHLYVTELDTNASATQSPTGPQNVKSPFTDGLSSSSSPSVCVTCDHHPEECLYNQAKMSPSTNYYMFHCFGPGVPRVELRATRRRRHRNFLENLVNHDERIRQRKYLSHPDKEGSESVTLNVSTSSAGDGFNGINQNSSSLLWTFESNKWLRNKLENQKLMPLTLRLKVPIPETDYQADVLLILPPQLAPAVISSIITDQRQRKPNEYLNLDQLRCLNTSNINMNGQHKAYPMVVDVYGGPSSQKVDFRFSVNFGHYLASNKQIVYAMIDGRGSGYQGSRRLYELYHRLGTVEIQDQIDVASRLAHSLWFLNPAKVAIWGWSYGGYAAAMSLAESKLRAALDENNNGSNFTGQTQNPALDSNAFKARPSNSVFKCAASVAPVTNWIYYDTAYTERYMSSPWANEKYDNLLPGDHLVVDGQPSPFALSPSFSQNQRQQDPLVVNRWTPLNQTLASFHIQPFRTAQRLLDLMTDPSTTTESTTSVQRRRRVALTQIVRRASSNNNNKFQLDLNERYKRASLLEQAPHLDSNSYLLVHGTADDNVNFQQSIMLMKRLIKRNILFETRLYPDQDHGIAEFADKLHLGSTLSNFLVNCLA